MHLRYNLYDNPDPRHAQDVMRDLGITYQHATPQSMGSQWLFWNCENVPDPLPEHFSVLDVNPRECVGYGLSKEEAEAIATYEQPAGGEG